MAKRKTLSRVSNTDKAWDALNRLLNNGIIDFWQWKALVEAEQKRSLEEVIAQLYAKWGPHHVYKDGWTKRGAHQKYSVELRGGVMTYILRGDRLVRYRYVRHVF